jgi:5-formyltetrahydrofolate cyclo-ligase
MVHATLSSAKTVLRAEMRALRKALAERSPDAAEQAAAHLPMDRLPAFAVVAGYHPHGAEIAPYAVLDRLAATGATVALPAAVTRENPLVFRVAEGRHTFVPDAFGVPSPPPASREVHPDIIIAPLVAFDRRGLRLGQGAGSYDRTIQAARAQKPVFVIGLAYAGQEVARVPCEPHDMHLDAILTENGYIEVRKDPS